MSTLFFLGGQLKWNYCALNHRDVYSLSFQCFWVFIFHVSTVRKLKMIRGSCEIYGKQPNEICISRIYRKKIR
jgi:hypothetical protein